MRGVDWVTASYFGADPLGVNDSTAALQNAINAMAGIAGRVILGPGSFKHNDSLHPAPGVTWVGVPDNTFVNINHATKDQLIWDTGSSRKAFTQIEHIGFGATIDNTGTSCKVPNTADLRLKFKGCTWNEPGSGGGPRLKGKLLDGEGTSTVAYDDCYLNVIGDEDALFLSAAGGELVVENSRLIMPVTYTHNLIDVDDGVLRASHNYFDVTAHGGSADIIQLTSLGYHVLDSNEFHGAFSSGACIKTTSGGILIDEHGSVFDLVNQYALGGILGDGSKLTLGRPLTTATSSATPACATGYAGQTFKSTGTAPNVTLPTALFNGQEFALVMYNNSGGGWAGVGFSGLFIGGAAGAVATGQARGWRFKALNVKNDGVLYWVSMADASSAWGVP